MDLNKAIQNRHSVRKFKDKKPDWRNIIECIDAARYAPMAGNIYSIRFILIDDKKTIQEIADAAQQQFISMVHYVVVVCSEPRLTSNAYSERGNMYLKQQAGAAIQNFLLKIEEAGLSTTWVGAFVDNMVKKSLKIPENIEIEAIFPIGYEYEKKYTRKLKIDLDNILYFNQFKNKKMKPQEKLDV